MTEEEFRSYIRKASAPKEHKIKNSLGVYDAYKYIRKNKWFNIGRPLIEKEFYRIIRKVNNLIAQALSESKEIVLPLRMGVIELRKFSKKIRIVNGKLKTNLPVNWDATLKLWYEDEDAYSNRTLVRLENNDIFVLKYNKTNADYTNKTFYEFRAGRSLRNKVSYSAKTTPLDAYLISKYYDQD